MGLQRHYEQSRYVLMPPPVFNFPCLVAVTPHSEGVEQNLVYCKITSLSLMFFLEADECGDETLQQIETR